MQPHEIDVGKLDGLSDRALEKTNFLLHDLYEDCFVDNDVQKTNGVQRKGVVISAVLLSGEMAKRNIPTIDDTLSAEAQHLMAKLAGAAVADISYVASEGAALLQIAIEKGEDVLAWSVAIGRGTSEAAVTKRAASFNLDGDRYARALREPSSLPATSLEKLEEGEHCVAVDRAPVEFGLAGEFFLTGERIAGTLQVTDTEATLRKSCLPSVLTAASVLAKAMPSDGESGLPRTVEEAIPSEYHYWKSSGEDARKLRDDLVATRFLTSENVQIVSGEYKRVVKKVFLYVPPADGATLQKKNHLDSILGKRDYALLTPPEGKVTWGGLVGECVGEIEADTVLVITDPQDDSVDALAKALAAVEHDYVVGMVDTPASRCALAKLSSPFHLLSDNEYVWAYSGAVAKSRDVSFLASAPAETADAPSDEAADLAKVMSTQVIKTIMPEEGAVEERFILGVVLEPEVVDAQKDVYSKEEVRAAAHRFMESYQNVGLMHRSLVNEQVKILESYVTPADLTIGGIALGEGTWLLGVRVLDDELWAAAKAGELTGFSIGGSAIRVPGRAQVSE